MANYGQLQFVTLFLHSYSRASSPRYLAHTICYDQPTRKISRKCPVMTSMGVALFGVRKEPTWVRRESSRLADRLPR